MTEFLIRAVSRYPLRRLARPSAVLAFAIVLAYGGGGILSVLTYILPFILFLGFCLVKWLQDDVYGVNNTDSLIFMGALYLLALSIYVGSRIYRRRQGMDLKMVYGEIPAE